jgi:hypothetical protein
MRKRGTSRSGLDEDEAIWVSGVDDKRSFVPFMPNEHLQHLWDQFGDHDAMYWQPGMLFPMPL